MFLKAVDVSVSIFSVDATTGLFPGFYGCCPDTYMLHSSVDGVISSVSRVSLLKYWIGYRISILDSLVAVYYSTVMVEWNYWRYLIGSIKKLWDL